MGRADPFANGQRKVMRGSGEGVDSVTLTRTR